LLTFSFTQHLRNDAANILLEEAFVDLDPHLNDVFSRRWFDGSSPAMETILVTLNDYFSDYKHLTDKNYEYVAMVCLNTSVQKYIMNMLQKKMPFKGSDERTHAAEKSLREARQLEDFFSAEVPDLSPSVHPCHVMASLAEVIKVRFYCHRLKEISS
jgi:exocyst complex component 3